MLRLITGLLILGCLSCIGSARAYSPVQNNNPVSSEQYINNRTTEGLKNISYLDQKGSLSDEERKISSDLFKRITPAAAGNKGVATNTGDDVASVYISIIPPASTHVIDPFVLNVTGRDEENHLAVAWVNSSCLLSLASLAEVRQIRTVTPPHERAITNGTVQDVYTTTPLAQGTEMSNLSGTEQHPPPTRASGPGTVVIGGLLPVLIVIHRIVMKTLK
jgi:hypothetical protein